MKAGQTKVNVGTRVRLTNIRGEDSFLNGFVGTVTHPFAFGETKKGWVGVWLDSNYANSPYGGQCNVKETEIIIL